MRLLSPLRVPHARSIKNCHAGWIPIYLNPFRTTKILHGQKKKSLEIRKVRGVSPFFLLLCGSRLKREEKI